MIYRNAKEGPLIVRGVHDPDTLRAFGIICKPPVWQAQTLYNKNDCDNYDIVIPAEFTGRYYKVHEPGISGASEPPWEMDIEHHTPDGTKGLEWETVLYNLMPPTLHLESAVVTALHGSEVKELDVTVSDGAVDWLIQPLASDAAARAQKYFDIHVHGIRSDSTTFECTLRFNLGEK